MVESTAMSFKQEAFAYSQAVGELAHKLPLNFFVYDTQNTFEGEFNCLVQSNTSACSLRVGTRYPEGQWTDVGIVHFRTLHRMEDDQLRKFADAMDKLLHEDSLMLISHKPLTIAWKWLEEKRRWWRRVIKGDPYYRRTDKELVELLKPLRTVMVADVISEDKAIDEFSLIGCIESKSSWPLERIIYRGYIKERCEAANNQEKERIWTFKLSD